MNRHRQPVISAQELEFLSETETETKAEEEEEAAHLAAAEASEEAVAAPEGAVFEEEADPEEADKSLQTLHNFIRILCKTNALSLCK